MRPGPSYCVDLKVIPRIRWKSYRPCFSSSAFTSASSGVT